ncbi:MAG: hypothetical protein MHM6MM_004341 [Cercozoa sp. M6MM]
MDIIALLLAQGARIDLENCAGQVCYECAPEDSREEIKQACKQGAEVYQEQLISELNAMLTAEELGKFKLAFRCIDADEDGIVTVEDIRRVMYAQTNLNPPAKWSEIVGFFAKLDADGDGKLTMQDFLIACASHFGKKAGKKGKKGKKGKAKSGAKKGKSKKKGR